MINLEKKLEYQGNLLLNTILSFYGQSVFLYREPIERKTRLQMKRWRKRHSWKKSGQSLGRSMYLTIEKSQNLGAILNFASNKTEVFYGMTLNKMPSIAATMKKIKSVFLVNCELE